VKNTSDECLSMTDVLNRYESNRIRSGLNTGSIRRPLLILLRAIIFLLAVLQSVEVYRAVFTSDEKVEALCEQSLDRELKCWCYNKYARTCP